MPYRYGFVVEALLLAVETVIIYNANKAYSKSKTCLVLGVTGAFCIGVVGVVNEQECNPVHSSKHCDLINFEEGLKLLVVLSLN